MFSGTNRLTSCHSATCLISDVFGSRKASKEIFSELDGTNVKVNNFPWRTRSPEGSRIGRLGRLDPPRHGWALPHAWEGCEALGRRLSLPLCLYP